MGKLGLLHPADLHHLLRPALVLHIKKQHSRRIRYIGTEAACKHIRDIVLGQHDLADSGKILRLLIFYPENLWRRESCKSDICRVLREFIPADNLIQIIRLFLRPAVIPQNCRANNLVLRIQNHKPMHLSAKADACYLRFVTVRGQLLQALLHRTPPVLRLLLTPTRLREIQGILSGHNLSDLASSLHQQQLNC